jgi:competence protein ComEA
MLKPGKLITALLLLGCAWCASAEPVDINSATADQIAQGLVGIGKAKAEAIVQDREKNGKFKSIDDLERVKGIGPATIEKNRDKIVLGMDTQNPPSVSPKSK